MSGPSATVRDLARRILELELAREPRVDLAAGIERAFQRLHEHLVKVVGQAGFRALVDRAASLTGGDARWLANVTIELGSDLAMKGLLETAATERADRLLEGATVLFANVIQLLCTFIGEELTLRLIHKIWTDLTPDAAAAGAGPTSTEGS